MKRRLTEALGGALVFAIFGGAWAAYGVYSVRQGSLWLAAPVAITMILLLVLGRFQRKVEALPDGFPSADADAREARARKMFTIVNLAQAVAIFLAVQVWFNLKKPEYLAPTIAVIVGLHFLALAGPMELPSHRVPGTLMIVLAVGVVVAAPVPSWGLVIGLGCALILWGCYALRLREVMSGL